MVVPSMARAQAPSTWTMLVALVTSQRSSTVAIVALRYTIVHTLRMPECPAAVSARRAM